MKPQCTEAQFAPYHAQHFMCGILGIWQRRGGSVDRDRALQQRDAMRHRGPDDAGTWVREPSGDVLLAHRRLAIVDLSPAGRAPMANEDGTVQVTFNGEIYNHDALREDLRRRGHVFRSRCDTEVLVHLYEEYGADLVDHLVGMFAFAIWDEARERLVVARDRLGIKPLYWLDLGGTFACASEIKALLPMLPRREVDAVAAGQYLSFVAVPPPRTLFADVSKLAPASVLIVDRDGPSAPRRYWDPIANRAAFSGDASQWEDELLGRLRTAVDRRMMSDVPVGAFLSGGVDSSANVALMCESSTEPINTFSVGFDGVDAGFSEFGQARRVAEHFGTNHHEVHVSADDLWGFLPDLIFHQDEPIADPNCVPQHFLAKRAKQEGVTVVHVGEGADEILAGYPAYVRAHRFEMTYWRRMRRLPQPLRSVLARGGAAAAARRPALQWRAEILERLATHDGRLWWGGAVAFAQGPHDRITTNELRRQVGDESARDVVAQISADGRLAGARNALDLLIYQDLRLRLPELLLMRVDKLTMANAVEARVPFLDHEVVELAMGMPTAQKIQGSQGKHVLKRAVERLLPADIVWQPKRGFATPMEQWFRGPLGEQFERQLRTSAIHELGYFERPALQEVLATHRSGAADRSLQLWSVMNLSAWFDHWIAGRSPVADVSLDAA